jgi:hypothetical protein
MSQYYVRFRGHVTGPFSTTEVLAQWRSGKISGLHEVSADGASWTPLSRMQIVADPFGEEKLLDSASAAALRSASVAAASIAAAPPARASQSESLAPTHAAQHAAAVASSTTSKWITPSHKGRWMYCSECGVELMERAIMCPSCGCPTRNHKETSGPGGEVGAPAIAALYIVGFFIPIVGWIGAIYLLGKGHLGNASGVGALSLFAFFFWLAAFGVY